MKSKSLIYAAFLGVAAVAATPGAHAQKFALRPHAAIGLGSAACIDSSLPMDPKKSSSNQFGLDFGYTFWEKAGNALSVNIGVDYRPVAFKLTAGDLSYSYEAPASADMDGDTYVRYYYQDVKGLYEKIEAGYMEIPLYLGYAYRITDWLDVYANLGVTFDFKCAAKIKEVQGTVDTYGVYPQYGDLMIDESYLNGFGENSLSGAAKGHVAAKSFMSTLLVGAGFEARIYGPLWFNLGVAYNCGFSDIFGKGLEKGAAFTEATAPVTYTVAGGEQARALSDYLTKSRLSAVSLNLGLTFKF